MPALGTRAVLAALAALALAPAAPAQTWTGAAITGSWNTPGNWDSNPAPAPNSPTAAVTFPSLNGPLFPGTVNIQTSVQAQSLTFSNTSGNYTITSSSGQTLSGVTGITVGSGVTATDTISAPVSFPAGSGGSGPFSITNNATDSASPTLSLGGTINTTGTGGVVVSGSGYTRITGAMGTPSSPITGGLVKSGPGRLDLATNNALQGSNTTNDYSVVVNGGTLGITSEFSLGDDTDARNRLQLNVNSATSGGLLFLGGNTTIARTVTLASTTRVVCTGTNTDFISGFIDGSGDLVKDGTGTLFLTNDTNGFGNTVINGGTLAIGADALGKAGSPTVTFNGGTLSISSSISRFFHPLVLNSAGGTIDVTDSQTLTQLAAISGSGSLTKTGAGTLVVQAAATYSGDTLIQNGTLVLAAANSLPSGGRVVLGSGTTSGTLDLAQIPVQLSSLTTSGTGTANTVTNSSTTQASLTLNMTSDATYSGAFSGNLALIKTGSATLTLAGDSGGWGGPTTVSAGALALQSANALGSGTVTVNVKGGLGFGTLASATLGGLAGTGDLDLGSTAVTVGGNNANTTYSGALTGTASGSLTKVGSGILILSGDNSTYKGGVAINAGFLKVTATNALAASTVTVNTQFGLTSPSGLSSVTLGGLAGTGDLGLSNTALTVGGYNQDTTYSGAIQAGISLTKVGTGTLTLTGTSNTYTGGTFLNGGTVSISADTNLGSGGLSFGGGTLRVTASHSSGRAVAFNAGGGTVDVDSGVTLTLSGALGGTGGLTKSGAGTLALTGGSNGFSGGTTVAAGTLAVGAGGTLPTAGGVTVNSGATLDLTALTNFAVRSGTLGGAGTVLGSVTVTSGGAIRPGGPTTVGTLTVGVLALQGGATLDVAAGNMAASQLSVTHGLTLTGA
jgi:fibronectin-binding autotransporter adhesin